MRSGPGASRGRFVFMGDETHEEKAFTTEDTESTEEESREE